jgi:hypothetical protein
MEKSMFGDRIRTLKTIFRLTRESASYIKESTLVPDTNDPITMAHDVTGMKVSTTSINVDSIENIKHTLFDVIGKAALKINSAKNVHSYFRIVTARLFKEMSP